MSTAHPTAAEIKAATRSGAGAGVEAESGTAAAAVKPAAPTSVVEASDKKTNELKPVTVTGAVARLALSRERLRVAMLPKPKVASSSIGGGIGSFATRLRERAESSAGASVVLDAVRAWWAQHPLRTVSLFAAEASRKFAAPVAERSPLMLLGGAVLVGVLLAVVRPWRWLLRPALFAGLLPALAARAMRELPVDSVLKMLKDFLPATARAAAGKTVAESSSTHVAATSAAAAAGAAPVVPPYAAPAETAGAGAFQPQWSSPATPSPVSPATAAMS